MAKAARSIRDCSMAIPDELLCLILSRTDSLLVLARCSAVCRRWRSLVPFIHRLCISVDDVFLHLLQSFPNHHALTPIVTDIISAALLRSIHLHHLSLCFGFHSQHLLLTAQDIANWLLKVSSSLKSFTLGCNFKIAGSVSFFHSLSLCTRLARLSIYGAFDLPEAHQSCVLSIRDCKLVALKLRGASLEEFLKICPNLDSLHIAHCRGSSLLNFNAALLTRLFVWRCRLSVVHVKAPQLKSLHVGYVSQRSVINAPVLQEIVVEGSADITLEECSPLRSLTILEGNSGYRWELQKLTKLVQSCKNLKKLTVLPNSRRMNCLSAVPSKPLRHLESLIMHDDGLQFDYHHLDY